MNIRAVVFGFFVVLAATLNFGFVVGDLDDPALHNVYELFAAVVVNLVATGLKLNDRSHVGGIHLASSLVADLQLLTAAVVWVYAVHLAGDGYTPQAATIMYRCRPARCSPISSRCSCSWSRRSRSATVRCSTATVRGLGARTRCGNRPTRGESAGRGRGVRRSRHSAAAGAVGRPGAPTARRTAH